MKNVFKQNGAVLFLSISLALLNSNCNNPKKDASPQQMQMVKDYYAAYEKKDWSVMEPILAEGFTFTSPAGDDHISLNVYKERCWPNALKTKKFDLEKIILDGDMAYVTYNGWTTDDKLFRNTELFIFKDGKIISNECFFGTGVSFPNNASTEK